MPNMAKLKDVNKSLNKYKLRVPKISIYQPSVGLKYFILP